MNQREIEILKSEQELIDELMLKDTTSSQTTAKPPVGSSAVSVKILCAAIHIKDGKDHLHQPKNIETGFVVCGRRHHNCFYILSLMGNPEYKNMSGREGQGFVTSDNNFVSRKEGYLIAKEAGQLLHNLHDMSNPILISEDVW